MYNAEVGKGEVAHCFATATWKKKPLAVRSRAGPWPGGIASKAAEDQKKAACRRSLFLSLLENLLTLKEI